MGLWQRWKWVCTGIVVESVVAIPVVQHEENKMEIWAQRGKIFLSVVFGFMALTYLAERLVCHTVAGFSSSLTSLVLIGVLVGMGYLIWQGYGWLRWLLGAFFILNGLGTPRGIEEVFGPALATLLALMLLVAHVGAALALCLTPGIPAFLRHQRARRKTGASDTAAPSS